MLYNIGRIMVGIAAIALAVIFFSYVVAFLLFGIVLLIISQLCGAAITISKKGKRIGEIRWFKYKPVK